ncbi:MAG: hypothetical protein M3R72_08675, partial [Bacteroidota bacterium]|nr:hypothetical protein [Bacteroidota bacterium]
PAHHRIEEWLIHRLSKIHEHHSQIRLQTAPENLGQNKEEEMDDIGMIESKNAAARGGPPSGYRLKQFEQAKGFIVCSYFF